MKISDFRLSEYFIRKFCSKENINFNDLDIVFSKESGIIDNKIHLNSNDSFKLSQTIYQITFLYLNNLKSISKQELNGRLISSKDINNYLNIVLSIVRDMSYGDENCNIKYLNDMPALWILLKDFLCPAFNVASKNIQVLCKETPYVDGAKYFENEDSYNNLIILNSHVKNSIYIFGHLLVESIIAHGLRPSEVILKIFNQKELKDRFVGFLKLIHFNDSQVNTLLSLVFSMLNIESQNIKLAQSINQSWWYIGLIENMLEPARGSDWTIYNQTKDDSQHLWEKVEEKKKKLGLSQLPFDMLLRIQSEDFATDNNKIMQKLLSDVRVW